METEKLKKYLPLAAAGVLGVGAAGLGWTLVQPQPVARNGNGPIVDQKPAVPMANMVVAARAISAGDPIDPAALKTVEVPVDVLPPTAFGSVAAMMRSDAFDGGAAGPRVAAGFIAQGQPIMAEHLAPAGSDGGLAALLSEGMRAYTLDVDTYTGLRGFLQPDARVDIVTTLRGDGGSIARTIVQDIRVLAVDGTLAGRAESVEATDGEKLSEEGPKNSVTLLVTPEQAARIELAKANGSPRLILRAAGDRTLSRFEGLSLAELTGKKPEQPAPQSDPWGTVAGSAPDPFDAGNQVASLGGEPIEQPGPVGGAGGAEPADAPASRPAPRKPHVVEVIRGGVSDKAVVPGRAAQPGQRSADATETAESDS